jgi:hypothetical protein
MSEAEQTDWVTEDGYIRFIAAQSGGRFELIDRQIVARTSANHRHRRFEAA